MEKGEFDELKRTMGRRDWWGDLKGVLVHQYSTLRCGICSPLSSHLD